jgi:hypothetical protein
MGECRILVNRNWTAMDKHLQIAEERSRFDSLVGRVVNTLGLKNIQHVTEIYAFRPAA